MKEQAGKPVKGLHTDFTPKDQPKDTYVFALNAVDETSEGDGTSLTNDEANKICAALPLGYQIIGKVYISNDKTALFLVHEDEGASEIGILDSYCKYTTVVNDSAQLTKLGFKISNQIDATYRLRRGCEDTVYFVDGNNDDRYFNFGQPDDFKNGNVWDIDKFKLDKNPTSVPTLESIQIKEEGNLPPGSYNIAVSLVDQDFNSTSILFVTEPIVIYNDKYSEEFKSITGSTTEAQDYYKYNKTSKAIEITLDNIDDSYAYYRVFLVEANVANGAVSKVSYSRDIPIDQPTFVATGDNTPNASTESEILAIENRITASQHIDQIDNRLIRANSKGSTRDFCEMQQLASKIRTNLALKEVTLNDVNIEGNNKRGTIHEENSLGCMPGEIYALGIVYTFPDNEESPVFHIPGRNTADAGNNMSANNTLTGVTYSGNTCTTFPFWGADNTGADLAGQPVRHHRFPTRAEAGIPLYTENILEDTPSGSYIHTHCVDIDEEYNDNYNYDTLYLRIRYDNVVTGETNVEYIKSIPNTFVSNGDPIKFTACLPEVVRDTATVAYVVNQVKFVNPQGNDGLFFIDPVQTVGPLGVTAYASAVPIANKVVEYKSQIMGFDFSNISLPIGATGYYIVRMDRDDTNKTVLDTGILSPLMVDAKYEAFGAFNPDPTANRGTERWVLNNPEYKFLGKEHTNITRVVREGIYTVTNKRYTSNIIQDVQAGTSYDPTIAKKREEDEDGFDLHTFARYNDTTYANNGTVLTSNVTDVRYLSALSNTTMSGENVFNVSADNKIGILEFDSAQGITDRVPYVSLRRDLTAPYANFRTGKYYKQHTNKQNGATYQLFNGDTYITPWTLTNTIFYDIRLRNRSAKSGIWRIVGGTLLVAFGVLATILTLGIGIPATAFIIGAGLSAAASGINQAIIKKTYQEEYEKGLKQTIQDVDTNGEFGGNPPDDEIQWFADILPNIWLESTVNMNWRTEPNYGPQTFQYTPDFYNINRINNYLLDKLSVIDTENEGGRLYQGFANAEVYFMNKDYLRRNRMIPYFPLGPQYDCCSACLEEFPHRVTWSEQSFQEELTDNYRTALANNYRDIEGETGPVTDLFTLRNNLFIHTAEGLWHLPQNIQERVTGDVVSFIGTGEYFAIPPRRIIDDETGLSGGNEHKWGTLKTPYGVIFPCEAQRVIYQFDGNSLKPISSVGNFSLFKEIIPIAMDEDYRRTKDRDFPYRNNPANKYGSGFHSTYDSKKERILITKRDLVFTDAISANEDFEVAYYQGDLLIFENYQTTINNNIAAGLTYEGIINNEMVFEIYNTTTGKVEVTRITGAVIDPANLLENSWTISYSLKNQAWRSFHSFMPQFYIHTPERFFSFINGNRNVWQHNTEGLYQNYYGVRHPFIVDYISNSAPIETRISNHLLLVTDAEKFNTDTSTFVDERFITFNKAILYNSRQCTGLLNLEVKDTKADPINYMNQQVNNLADTIKLDRNERNWTANDFRDIRVDYTLPIWRDNLPALQADYYIDKVLNTATMDVNKDWTQMESFRDKYLGIRLIFDTFDDIKLSVDYSIVNEQKSFR